MSAVGRTRWLGGADHAIAEVEERRSAERRRFRDLSAERRGGALPLTVATGAPAQAMNLADSHADLARLWGEKETKRADGGWWSLSGFSIQATVGLERFVRRLLVDQQPGLVAFEAVSDITEVDQRVRLTQVKRTLTKDSLASAVLEACKIVALCTPAFAKRLEFQVICERDDARIAPKDLSLKSIFKDAQPDVASHQTVLAQFNKVPVKVMTSPGTALRRTLLAAGVRNPDRVARDALGTLFNAFDGDNRAGVEAALYKAIDHVQTNARPEDRLSGRLLAPEMFERQSQGKLGLVTRARPRLTDLVGNRFLARPRLLDRLLDATEAWLTGLEASYTDDDFRLPVFWVEGRSGDGKSVLTLQLLEALIQGRARLPSVTELDSEDELLSWLKSVSPWDEGPANQAEIGFVDDLASRLDRAELDSLVDRAFYRGSTYAGLITCGTSESRKEFSRARHINLTPVVIPAPSSSDYEALRTWAEGRLGRTLKVFDSSGLSVSQFMMRLTLDGTSSEAGSRRVSPSLRAAMAINVLGLPAPRALATDEAVSEFVDAWKEIDLSPAADAVGVRLAHAEAIWPLYLETIGAENLAASFGSDLGHAMAARLQAGEATAARTLLGSLMNSRGYVIRLQRSDSTADGVGVMNAAFNTLATLCAVRLRAPLLRLWLPARLGGRLTEVEISELRNEGHAVLLDATVDPEVQSEVAATLLLVGRQVDDAHRAAASHLKTAGAGYAAGKFAVTALGGRYGADLVQVAMAWLRRNKDAAEIGAILSQVLVKGASTDLQEFALAYVRRNMAEPASGPVLRALCNLNSVQGLAQLRDDWLRTCADPQSAVALYRDQLQSREWRRYVAGALKLVAAHPLARSEQDLLSIMVRRRSDDPSVMAAARAWLDHRAGDASTTPVLLEMIASPHVEAQDLQRGIQHVDEMAPGYGAIFSTLSVVLKTLPQSKRAALRAGIPYSSTYTFDHAFRWKIKLSGRLQALDERLREKSANRPSPRRQRRN